MDSTKLIGTRIVAKVQLHHYRHPRSKAPVSGDFAIVILSVNEVLEGTIPEELQNTNSLLKDYTITVTGKMPRINEGEEYIFQGTLVNNKEWGYQYECESIRLDYNMSEKEDQIKFFSYFMTEKQIEALFAANPNPMLLLEQKNIGALTKIKGIGPVTATRMCLKYAENKDNGRAYVELKSVGLTKHAIDKLIDRFGSADVVVELINNNPYELIRLVRGYGWERADAIALKRGFTKDCRERCIAYATYFLECNADRGNSRVDITDLITGTMAICAPVRKDTLCSWLKEEMIGKTDFEELYGKIRNKEKGLVYPQFYYNKDNHSVGLFGLRLIEKNIVTHLERLSTSIPSFEFDHTVCDNIIADVEKKQGFYYTDEQHKAIWDILNNNVSILTGSSGCGKTSTLKPLIEIFKYYGHSVAQCALSGRASSLLTEVTGLEGKTIHRLLAYSPEEERFSYNENNPLKSDVIILDETSMVGEELFLNLISAIKSGSKLIMLGDIKQLPPMSVGNILSDCITSGYINTNTLTKIQRQALKSGIIAQSIRVCQGTSIVKNDFSGEEIRGELKDFKLVAYSDAQIVHAKVIDEFKKLHFERKVPVDDIQIIVPMRAKGFNSCRVYNAEIQNIVNPAPDEKSFGMDIVDGDQHYTVFYRAGDRIMVTKNNYHAVTINNKEVPIFNGNMGHIVNITREYMVIRIDEVKDDILLQREDWNNITHSWACTCHKLQGSQAPYVIVDIDNGSYQLLTREWLYTALTRARRYCTLVGQPRAINTATRHSDIKQKQTWLKDDLHDLFIASQM